MSARSEARAAEHDYRTSSPAGTRFRIGDRVRCVHGVGVIEFIAHSNAMSSPLYTVAIDTRIKLRLLERDITREIP